MNFNEWIISTLGTGAALSVIVWLSRNWIITRLKAAVDHEYRTKLEKYKNDLKKETEAQLLKLQSNANIELEKYKVKIGPYSEKQFERYNELWVKLTELRHTMEDLWVSANERNLNRLSKDLNDTFRTLEKSALLIEPGDYNELIESLNAFAKYQIGKQTLINLRRHTGDRYVQGITEKIQDLIDNNEQQKIRLNHAMQGLMEKMRAQINGTIQ